MPAHRFDAEALERAYRVAARRVERGELPFAILGVANAAGTVRLDAVSGQGQEPRIGLDEICLLASITKPIVATAAMRLVEDGALGLKVPLAEWLPELRTGDARQAITPWHVLTHTTGIVVEGLEAMIEGGIDRPGLLERALGSVPAVTPGSRFHYITLPFELLALAMERATGETLPAILARTVLEPLGMDDTSFDPHGTADPGRIGPVVVSSWDGHRHLGDADPAISSVMAERYTALRLAGGGLWSTAHDLLRFGRAMLRGGELDGARILSPAFVDVATREVTVDGLGREENRLEDGHYALGWGKPSSTNPSSARGFGHGGQSGTRLWIDPEHDLVLVYLSSSWGMPATVMDEVVAAVYAALR
jgi:CubicO group peptidase (beta-lactamase class C family)